MRVARGSLPTVAAALASLGFAPAALASPTARVVYSRSADAISCPDEAALRRAVALRTGYDVFFPWAPRAVVVAIVRRAAEYVATVNLVDEAGIDHGGHELHTSSACADLLDAVALAVAIAVDPESTLATSPPAPSSDPEPAPPPPPLPPFPLAPSLVAAEPVAPSAPAPRQRFRFEASLGAVASAGMAPSPTVGATLGAGARWSRFSVSLEGAVDAPASKGVASSARASAWLAYGAVVPCVSIGPAFGCAVAQLGSLQSSGEDVTPARSQADVWWALGGRVGGMLPITERLALRFRLDVVGDLRPTTLQLFGATAWAAPAVAGSVGIEAVVRFR